MKVVCLLFYLSIILCRSSFSQKKTDNEFKVVVKEWARFVNNKFVITNDSIQVIKSSLGLAGEDKVYNIAIPEKGSQKIIEILKATIKSDKSY